jgi:hypothetical protein
MNFLVETKTEYTIQLINIITPFMYEGFKSIYDEAIKISKNSEELKVFQTLLRRIPSWNNDILKAETKRILMDSNFSDILEDLLKAVIKSNIMILTNTPPENKNKLKINFIIEFDKFIHNAYIESAKNIFQNPFLFFHKCTPLELKRNERDACETIKNSIMDAIRKMLPINMILKEYLGKSYTDSPKNEPIDKIVSEHDKSRIEQLLDADKESDHKYTLVKKNTNSIAVDKIDTESNDKTEKNEESLTKSEIKDIRGGNNENDIEMVKKNMPQHFKKSVKDIDTVSASESYIPNTNMNIFEKYKSFGSKEHSGGHIDKNTKSETDNGSIHNKIEIVSNITDEHNSSVSVLKTGHKINQKNKYINRDFKFNF